MGKSLKVFQAGLLVTSLLVTATAGFGADIKERTLRFALQSIKEHPIGVGAQKFSDLVGEKSGGKISVKLFPNGTLGGDLRTVSALQGGVVDMTALSSGLLAGQVKEFVVFDLPFMINEGREADAVVDGPIGMRLGEKLSDKGPRGTGLLGTGLPEPDQQQASGGQGGRLPGFEDKGRAIADLHRSVQGARRECRADAFPGGLRGVGLGTPWGTPGRT